MRLLNYWAIFQSLITLFVLYNFSFQNINLILMDKSHHIAVEADFWNSKCTSTKIKWTLEFNFLIFNFSTFTKKLVLFAISIYLVTKQIFAILIQGWIDYFANVGGLLGLCIGVSIVTLVEIIWLCMRLMKHSFETIKGNETWSELFAKLGFTN